MIPCLTPSEIPPGQGFAGDEIPGGTPPGIPHVIPAEKRLKNNTAGRRMGHHEC